MIFLTLRTEIKGKFDLFHLQNLTLIQTYLISGQEPTTAVEQIVRNSQQTTRLPFANFRAPLVYCLVWYDMSSLMSQMRLHARHIMCQAE